MGALIGPHSGFLRLHQSYPEIKMDDLGKMAQKKASMACCLSRAAVKKNSMSLGLLN
jgi:hypothetical protein